MYALTIKQPWASLIIEGTKRIENRTWKPKDSILGSRIAIHASQATDALRRYRPSDRELPRGALLGTVVLVKVVTSSPNKYFIGPYGWVLADPVELTTPIPWIGQLGLWELDSKVL